MVLVTVGTALVRTHFPQWKYDDEAYYLSCLFHDIGTADRYLSTTKMSFEFKGAIVAREFILNHGGDEDIADGICEVHFTLLVCDLCSSGGRLLSAIRTSSLREVILRPLAKYFNLPLFWVYNPFPPVHCERSLTFLQRISDNVGM